ncbi:MAG: phosphoribosylglycinamide formyltransferase [Bacteroides sp.]
MQFFAHFLEICALNSDYMRKNIAIFASGSGTNTENIIRFFENHPDIKIELVVSNKSEAPVLTRSTHLNVTALAFSKEEWQRGNQILNLLKKHKIDFIVLAGFLIRVPESILHIYPNKIINIHPALLPKFGGKGMYGSRVHEAVLQHNETKTGITIHYINEKYDEGDIIFQSSIPVEPNETPDSLAQKVHQLEYQYYPIVIENLLKSLE